MRALVIILWIVLGIVYWFLSKQCCDADKGRSEIIGATEDGREVLDTIAPLPRIKLTPLAFRKSSFEVAPEEPFWTTFRDSLVRNLSSDQVMQVKGFYFGDEDNASTENDLGLARAKNVIRLLGLGADRTQVVSEQKGEAYSADEANNLIAFRYLRSTKNIVESDTGTTSLYFPYNSSKTITNAEIEAYLRNVADRINRSGEKIIITGHTDNTGTPGSNKVLGQWRADAVKNILVRYGVNPMRITTLSRGEDKPIASNDSDEGRSKNRRAELQFVK